MAEEHDPYAALRQPDYRRLLAGTVLAGIGSEVQATAVGWEVFAQTGRNDLIGYIGLVQFLPVLLLSLPAGQAADRHSRKALLAAALGLMAVASCGLAARSFLAAPVLLVYPCLLLTGVGRAFSAPARWSLVPAVVPARHLTNAVTWNSSGWQAAFAAGPSLGGLILALRGGAAVAYLTAAGCVLTAAALIATIRPQLPPRAVAARSLASLLAGAKFIFRTKLILATLTLDLFAVLFGGAIALLPAYCSRDLLDVGPLGFGWLRAAPALGAIGMAVLLAHRPPLRRAGPTLLWSVAGFGAATIVFGLSRNFGLSFVMLAVTGALDNVSVVVRGTLVQVLTPDEMRGRVSAVNAIFIDSSNRLGDFESGMTAQWFGPVASVVGGGVGTIVVVLAVMARWPQLLRLGALHRAGEEQPPPAELPTDQPIR
jgi:MFS family permease